MFSKKNLLGVGLTDERLGDILEYIEKILKKKEKKYFFITPNPEILVLSHKNSEYRKVLNDADLALIDGIGVIIAGKLLGKPLKHKISGIDFIESVCKDVAEKPITIGFLGAGAGVAEKTAECLMIKNPGLKVSFAVSELSELKANPEEVSSMPNTDILFVAFGSPKQEFWIKEHLRNLPITVAVGVGGAFDMISGKVPRAPAFIRTIGLEWLFRLIIQPWRIKRQIRLLQFMYLVAKEMFSHKS
ncbi:MAG: WecB/TagA/CpsF family glycosyltransferase [Candidatus Levybacteria bacterium]|nr:WecB/TagA/CpsF family glycosyltransferase [Candidatus Levybacteria bacterium]